jgi:ubiquinone/menaquinone biosynthesis C-methylase UbiE
MVAERIIETNEGIQDAVQVKHFDVMARHLRDKGYIETDEIIKSGIDFGHALEIGPGPGYLGLEWLKKTKGTQLSALDISKEMIAMSKKNAADYGFLDRISYMEGTSLSMPFAENTFDGVFSNGSLHEWESPVNVFTEVYRVLKKGGRFFVSDLRRDMNGLLKWFMKKSCKPKEMQPGFISSLNAAYTPAEIAEILDQTPFTDFTVKANPFGLEITGVK